MQNIHVIMRLFRGAGCGVRGAGCGMRGAGCGVRYGKTVLEQPSVVALVPVTENVNLENEVRVSCTFVYWCLRGESPDHKFPVHRLHRLHRLK